MGKVISYSDSEEFLEGMLVGASWVNDSSIDIGPGPVGSDNEKYAWMMVMEDFDQEGTARVYYNGSSLDYETQEDTERQPYRFVNVYGVSFQVLATSLEAAKHQFTREHPHQVVDKIINEAGETLC